jgi:hypothetical protein
MSGIPILSVLLGDQSKSRAWCTIVAKPNGAVIGTVQAVPY